MCGDTRLGAVVEPSAVSKPAVATATSLDQAAPLRMCAGSNHSIHVAVRDRLGRTFSSLSRWFVRSNATDKGTAATSLLSALVHMPGAVSGAPTNVVTVRPSTVDPDGEYGPILGSFDIVANRPGRVALCVYLAHPKFTASAPAIAAVPSDNVQIAHEISAVARCAPSFDSHLQVRHRVHCVTNFFCPFYHCCLFAAIVLDHRRTPGLPPAALCSSPRSCEL
jgi:hypothetical protein